MKQGTLFSVAEAFAGRTTDQITFKGKMGLPVHRWYRLTPSFSPHLAMDIADHFCLTSDQLVLDPFCGVGTVPLCMKYRMIPAFAIELNPYLHFVSKVKTRTYSNLAMVRKSFQEFIRRAKAEAASLMDESRARAYLRENAQFVPPIHNVERWWSSCNLAQLVALRKALGRDEQPSLENDLLRMAVLAILVPVSNARHNHVSLTFARNPLPTVDVVSVLIDKLAEMALDIQSMSGLPCVEVGICHGNSKSVSQVLPAGTKVSAVITSPPYPNRFSYARETRPHLFFSGFIEGPGAVGQLETVSIGGTWGKATSVLAGGVTPQNTFLARLLGAYIQDMGRNGGLMAAYVTKYFNDMYSHASEIARVCAPKARLAYVIGNSKFYGIPLPSDEMLAAVFTQFGFRLDGIHKMRRRQSKSGLYEAIVLMTRE